MIPTIDTVATGQNIRKYMERDGLKVRDIQEYISFASVQGIYKWLNGKTLPNIDNMVALSCLFGVTVDDILVIERG